MSIFGNKIDTELPLLTRLYQLDTEHPGECVNFLTQCIANGLRNLGSLTAPQLIANPDSYAGEFAENIGGDEAELAEDFRFQSEAATRTLEHMNRLTRSVLDGLAGPGAINGVDLVEIGETLSSRMVFKWRGATWRLVEATDGPVPLSEIDTYLSAEEEKVDPLAGLRYEVCSLLWDLIHEAQQGPGAVGVCEECGSVYVNSRRGRRVRFCSYRCANRRGQRERMRALRE